MHQKYAIFGDPVSHSISPLMHNYAFEALGEDACYGRYRLIDGAKLREKIFSLGLDGLNITVPHKEAAYDACDELDPFARKVGVVNTVVVRDGKLHGYNTDAPGFLRAIEGFEAKTVLFLGAGGTARSAAVVLKDAGYNVTILNRSAGRLTKFREMGFETYTLDRFSPRSYDLVVNMTSAGLIDNELPAPVEILEGVTGQAKGCIDVIYGKRTPFLKYAASKSVPTADGSDMLLYQGVIAFDHFTDHRHSPEEIEKHMRKAFV
jgi:shikimate dehydrogenase